MSKSLRDHSAFSPARRQQARRERAGRVLHWLCLAAALGNIGGNALLLGLYPDLFHWLGLPPPPDRYALACVSGLSLNVGVGALLVWLDPQRSTRLLFLCALAKGTFALISFSFYVCGECSWLWMVVGGWDAGFACVFALYLIHLVEPDLAALNATAPAVPPLPPTPDCEPTPGKALLVYFSLTDSGSRAIERVAKGLRDAGYAECTPVAIRPVEADLFRFPFARTWHLLRIMARAVVRIPAPVQPLADRLDAVDADYDLIVCETPTWMLGMAAPVEAALADPSLRRVIAGRDVALVNVARGAWQRSQAMMADRIRDAGGRVVGASAQVAAGREPWRLLSLAYMLARGKDCSWLPPSRPTDAAYDDLELFGRALAARRPDLPGAREEGARGG